MKILLAVDDDLVLDDVVASLHWCVRAGSADQVIVLHATGVGAWTHCVGNVEAAPDVSIVKARQRGAHIVAEVLERLSAQRLNAESLCVDDEVAEGILRVAQELRPDLIVVGARGWEERGFLIGSVSQKVKALTETDVLIVRRGAPYDRSSFRVLLAVDGSPASQRCVEAFVAKMHADRAEVRVIHALDLPSLAMLDVVGDQSEDIDMRSLPAPLRRHVEAALSGAVSALRVHGVRATTDVRKGRAADEILEVAVRNRSDLIVMGARGLSRLRASWSAV